MNGLLFTVVDDLSLLLGPHTGSRCRAQTQLALDAISPNIAIEANVTRKGQQRCQRAILPTCRNARRSYGRRACACVFSCSACVNTRRPGARTFSSAPATRVGSNQMRRFAHAGRDSHPLPGWLPEPAASCRSWFWYWCAPEHSVRVATQGLGDASPRDLAQSATFDSNHLSAWSLPLWGHDEATLNRPAIASGCGMAIALTLAIASAACKSEASATCTVAPRAMGRRFCEPTDRGFEPIVKERPASLRARTSPSGTSRREAEE
jgi:hypothetical protein